MKKIPILLILFSIFLFGCDLNQDVADLADPTFALESSDTGATETIKSVKALNAPNGLKVSFRSSDIEFWATGGDFTNLRSLKYEEWDGVVDGSNVSTEIALSDTQDNVVFMPNKVKLSEYDMPSFEQSKKYDVVRMDIGGGNILFTMDGSEMTLNETATEGNGDISANSIVLIDQTVLNNVVYADSQKMGTILNDYIDNNQLDGTYDFGIDTSFITDFIVNNTMTWSNDFSGDVISTDDAYTDINGALFVPFEPIDFTSNSNAKRVKIKIDWDLNTIFTEEKNGVYTLNDSADGTPYNFDINVEIK